MLFINLLIYLLVALSLRSSAELDIPLCEEHHAKRHRGILISVATLFAGIAALGVGILADSTLSEVLALLGPCAILAALVLAIVTTRVLTPVRIDKYYLHLRGACQGYLEQLPSWRAP